METIPLTAKQERLWRYIASCERSPTYDEMAHALGYPCKGRRIVEVVTALERRGYIRRLHGCARTIVALDPERDLSRVPTEALMAELERRRKA